MEAFDQIARYRDYLRRFGINEAGDRVTELRTLKLENVSFFAFASDGLRFKAALTPGGIVTPGRHADDDWHGFLSGSNDALIVAERIAWLETDSSTPPHGLPRAPFLVLDPDRRPAAFIDPAHWALVTAPTLSPHADGSTTFIAWFLPGGARVPERWTVIAQVNATVTIEHIFASDLVTSSSDATARARALLDTGTGEDRLWAVEHLVRAGAPAAVSSLTALLDDPSVAENIKVLAVAALIHCPGPEATAALGAALREHPLVAVRRAAAQSLGRIGAVQELAASPLQEPEVVVRAEIINALIGQGNVAREPLAAIARDDPNEELRALAKRGLDASA